MKLRLAFAALVCAATTPAFAATLVAESSVPGSKLSAFAAAGSKTFGSGFIVKNLPAPIPTPAPSAAPEPETWAMLIMGFGAIGVFGRRRPRPRVVAA